jgi:hypothetical protein
MPRMNVLNTVEREAFDSPPVFNHRLISTSGFKNETCENGYAPGNS